MFRLQAVASGGLMHNEALNQLRIKVSSMAMDQTSCLKATVDELIDKAIYGINGNDYVEDCLIQIDEAVARLDSEPENAPQIRDYLLGAIEALRDELRLCEAETYDQPKAVGF